MSINNIDINTVEIMLVGLPEYIPEKKGIIRMKKAEGSILLTSFGEKTEIIYEFHTEPGGNISPWIANDSIANLPFKTLFGLRKELENDATKKIQNVN